MKRLIVTVTAIAVLICLLVGVFSGCASTSIDTSGILSKNIDDLQKTINDTEQAHSKLVLVDKEVSFTWGAYCLRDTETGVEYWLVEHGYGAGLTPRLNPDGSYRTSNNQTTTEDNE